MQRYECFLEWQKYFLGVGERGVAGGQRVDTQPACHQLVVHIAGTEIAVAVFRVSLFPSEREVEKSHGN